MKTLNQFITEQRPGPDASDEEHEKYDNDWNDKVGDAHIKHIHKKFGKDVKIMNFGALSDEGTFTSKVYHPKRGRLYVTTHYDPDTLKVHKHEIED